MFPYLVVPPVAVGPLVLFPSQILLAAALATGYFVVRKRAARRGIPGRRAVELYVWMTVPGLLLAHVVKWAVYGDAGWWNGFLDSFTTCQGLASFGGIYGALLGAAAWGRFHRLALPEWLEAIDVFAFAFPFAWLFGRAGCALAHDHPGIRTASWLGVAYPGGNRYDLGLLEFFFTAALAVLFLALDRKQRPPGFFLATLLLLYGPFRHALDGLHVTTPLYFGVPPDRIFAAIAVIAGLAAVAYLRRASPAHPR